jgi:hypothetical protein
MKHPPAGYPAGGAAPVQSLIPPVALKNSSGRPLASVTADSLEGKPPFRQQLRRPLLSSYTHFSPTDSKPCGPPSGASAGLLEPAQGLAIEKDNAVRDTLIIPHRPAMAPRAERPQSLHLLIRQPAKVAHHKFVSSGVRITRARWPQSAQSDPVIN